MKTLSIDETICSTMHCYNPAKITDDPTHPPFCDECKAGKKVGKLGAVETTPESRPDTSE